MANDKRLALTMVTTWNDPCGIADYSKALVRELGKDIDVNIVELKKHQHGKSYFDEVGKRANQGDLVHIQHEYAFFGGLDPWQAGFKTMVNHIDKPIVMTAHTWLKPFSGGPPGRKLLRGIKKIVYGLMGWNNYLKFGQFKLARAIIVHNQVFKKYLIQIGLTQDSIRYFPQGIPKEKLVGDQQAAIKQYQLQGKKILLLFGFLMPSKGHLLALEMIKDLADDVVLVIAGEKGKTKSELIYARQVGELVSLQKERCLLTGYLSEQELHDLIAAATLCLFPYTEATSSYALSLALAHRKACVASSLENFLEFNQDRSTLAIFESGQVNSLRQVVNDLLQHPEQQQQLEAACDEWVKKYHWGSLAKEHIKLYQSILGAASE